MTRHLAPLGVRRRELHARQDTRAKLRGLLSVAKRTGAFQGFGPIPEGHAEALIANLQGLVERFDGYVELALERVREAERVEAEARWHRNEETTADLHRFFGGTRNKP